MYSVFTSYCDGCKIELNKKGSFVTKFLSFNKNVVKIVFA